MQDEFNSKWERYLALLTQTNVINKAVIFSALRAAKVALVEIEFDGEGDSGGITGTYFYGAAEERVEPDETKIVLQIVHYGVENATEDECTLTEAVERLGLAYLDQQGNGGWENNDGAFGTFRFDIAREVVEITFNARFCDVATNVSLF